jgi:hypothetical protein
MGTHSSLCINKNTSVSNFETFYIVSRIETMKRSSVYSDQYEALSSWLVSQRETKGLTLRDVSVATGLHHSIIGKIEARNRRIDVVEFVYYCRFLGVDPKGGLDVLIQSIDAEEHPGT